MEKLKMQTTNVRKRFGYFAKCQYLCIKRLPMKSIRGGGGGCVQIPAVGEG